MADRGWERPPTSRRRLAGMLAAAVLTVGLAVAGILARVEEPRPDLRSATDPAVADERGRTAVEAEPLSRAHPVPVSDVPVGRWERLPDPPRHLREPAVAAARHEVLVAGTDAGSLGAVALAWDLATDRWDVRGRLPLAAVEHLWVDGDVAVAVGDGKQPGTVAVGAVDGTRWAALPPTPLEVPRTLGVVDGHVVLFDDDRRRADRFTRTADVAVADVGSARPVRWRRFASPFGSTALGTHAVALDDQLVVLGRTPIEGSLSQPALSQLDPARGSWSTPEPVPTDGIAWSPQVVDHPDGQGLLVVGPDPVDPPAPTAWRWAPDEGWRHASVPLPAGLRWSRFDLDRAGEHLLLRPHGSQPALALRPGADAAWHPVADPPGSLDYRGDSQDWTGEALLSLGRGNRDRGAALLQLP